MEFQEGIDRLNKMGFQCSYNYRRFSDGIRVVLSCFNNRMELYYRLIQCGARIAMLKDGDIMLSDIQSITAAMEAI